MKGDIDDNEASRAEREYYAEEMKKYPVPSSPFVRAAADGDMDAVRRMIGEGVDVNQRDPGFKIDDKWTTRDPRSPNTFTSTAMEMAVRTHNLEMLKLLHDAGADPDHPDRDRPSSVVQLALGVGFLDGVRYLVDEQKHPLKDSEGRSPTWLLVNAIRTFEDREIKDKSRASSSVEMLRYLIGEKGIDPAGKTENGVTAASCANGQNVPAEVLEYLYSIGAVPFGTEQVTPLVQVRLHPKLADDLAGMGVDEGLSLFEEASKMSERFGSNSTLLNESVFYGDADKVRIHLKNGASALVADAEGVNAYGVLDILKKQPDTAIFVYHEEHDAVKALLDESVANRPRRKPAQPQP